MSETISSSRGDPETAGRNCCTFRHYADPETMPSEPPAPLESAPAPPVKAAVQLPLF